MDFTRYTPIRNLGSELILSHFIFNYFTINFAIEIYLKHLCKTSNIIIIYDNGIYSIVIIGTETLVADIF